MRRDLKLAAVALAMALGAGQAQAVTAFTLTFGEDSVSSNTTATGASGTVGFSFADFGPLTDKIATLSLEVTNTTGSPIFGARATESKLVQFGFDLVSGASYVAGSFSGITGGFDTIALNASASPFGSLAILTGVDGDFEGGQPTTGLDATESQTVSLRLAYGGTTATNALQLASLFADFFANDPVTASNKSGARSAMRFQSVNAGEGSDKLAGPDVSIIPVPAGALLIVSALGVAGVVSRMRRAA